MQLGVENCLLLIIKSITQQILLNNRSLLFYQNYETEKLRFSNFYVKLILLKKKNRSFMIFVITHTIQYSEHLQDIFIKYIGIKLKKFFFNEKR